MITYSISEYTRGKRKEYVYKCCNCGRELRGYRVARIHGQVRCLSCKALLEKQRRIKVANEDKIKVARDIQHRLCKEIHEDVLWQVLNVIDDYINEVEV